MKQSVVTTFHQTRINASYDREILAAGITPENQPCRLKRHRAGAVPSEQIIK